MATRPLRQSSGKSNGAVESGAASVNGLSGLLRERILREAEEIERDCRIAVHCHGRAAWLWNWAYYLLGLPTAIFAALSGVSAVNGQTTLAAALAVAATVSAAANTFLNAGQTTNAHAKKRSEYEQLKNEVRHFRTITMETHRPERELLRELSRHSARRDVLNLESPQVSNRAHEKALRRNPPAEAPAR
jgi:hypothetical protein